MMLDKRMASYSHFFTSPNGLAFRDTALECNITNLSKSHQEDVRSDIWGQRISEQSFRSKGRPLYKMTIHAAIGACGRLTEIPTRTRIRLAKH